jgi:hypothetical protein
MKRRLIGAGVTVLGVAVPALVALAPAAQATPSSCAWGPYSARGSYATCNYGSGAYRSFTQCSSWHGWYINYGPWETPRSGVLSISSCSWGDTRHSYGINLS